MDGADPGELELGQGFRQPRRSLSSDVFCTTGAFYLGTQPQLHFAGGLFGESDRNDAVERAYALADQGNDPAHQPGCLARSKSIANSISASGFAARGPNTNL